ncbi:Methyltransferase type 12 [metagenome]|uniref:Methyltransferase type 12 n=1 Tax=metagenome TaxID=256318 RepID=A0A2P2BZG0_9ZZZZ
MDANAWDARYAEADLVWSVEPNQFVAAECADLPPGRALDLAAGEGRNAIWLAHRGWEVTAVDFAQAGLEKGRRLAGDASIEWVCGDAVTGEGVDVADLDLVVIAYLQLPAAERGAAVRRGFDALRPGGTFLLVAHDSTNLVHGVGGPQDAAVLMTSEDVVGDLEGREFETIRAERVTRLVDDGHRGTSGQTAYDVLVRLVRR